MAVPHPDAVVVRGDCFVASRFPYPVLNNAVILDAPALDAVREVYGAEPYAVWSQTADEEFATRPDARRRGFGSRVVRAALRDALNDGYLTASLQAMPWQSLCITGSVSDQWVSGRNGFRRSGRRLTA